MLLSLSLSPPVPLHRPGGDGGGSWSSRVAPQARAAQVDQSKLSGWVDSNPTTPRENGHKVCCTTAGPPPEGKRRKTNRIVSSLLFPVGWTSSLILEALPESLICLSSGRREREWRCHLLPFLSAHDSASSRECPPPFHPRSPHCFVLLARR